MISSNASASCSWVLVQCTESAPFPGWPFGTIFRIGIWTLPWQILRSSVARFLSHSVYQLSVYLAPEADIGACLPTAFQVENSLLDWIQAPQPHTKQHQPPPDSPKTIIAVVRVLTADLSGLYVFSIFSPQEEREKHSYQTRIHDLSSLWHLRFTNSLSNGSCLCKHLSRLNSANGAHLRLTSEEEFQAKEYKSGLLRRVLDQALLHLSFILTVHSHASSLVLKSLAPFA